MFVTSTLISGFLTANFVGVTSILGEGSSLYVVLTVLIIGFNKSFPLIATNATLTFKSSKRSANCFFALPPTIVTGKQHWW